MDTGMDLLRIYTSVVLLAIICIMVIGIIISMIYLWIKKHDLFYVAALGTILMMLLYGGAMGMMSMGAALDLYHMHHDKKVGTTLGR